MTAYKCLKVNGGIIALIDLTGYDLSDISGNKISILLTDYGLLIKMGNIEIPIPESFVEYIIENRVITIYPAGIDDYVEEPVLSVELSKESLIEAKGVYNFWKKNSAGEMTVVKSIPNKESPY